MADITISSGSRYKDTPVYEGPRGAEFGAYRVPPDFDPTSNRRTHVVRGFEVGFLDALAVRYYGEGMETMWWVIAQANRLVDPEREMREGDELVIPPLENVMAFVARAPDEQT